MIADRRVSALRRRLGDSGLSSILVSGIANVRYLTGFEDVFDDEANVALVLTDQVARLYTDSRYSEACEIAADGTPWRVRVPKESVYAELCNDLDTEGLSGLAIESSVPYGRFKFISEKFGGRVEVVDQWVEGLRQTKESGEIERIAAAAELTDRAFEHIVTRLAPSVTEAQIALELEVFMRSHGSEGVAFDPIVASGPNSSRPHARVSSRPLEAGDLVTMDFGARVKGYCSDMTRTVVMGAATPRQAEIYAAVLDAQVDAIAAVKAGLPGSKIDAVARDLLTERGLGEYFGHGLGHGVGLDVHELPSVSSRARESVLAGAVITIEPGVYVPGFGGVRIEDLVLVEDGGCRVLSCAPKHLIQI